MTPESHHVLASSEDGQFKTVQYPNGDLRVTLLGARYTVERHILDEHGGNIMLRLDARPNGRQTVPADTEDD